MLRVRSDNLTPEQRRRCMSSVRTKDTEPESRIRSELHRRGLRFWKHCPDLPGKPDIVFPRARLVVFVDGDFWHGRNFLDWEEKLAPFWRDKIRRNIERDLQQVRLLEELGWTVVRIWERQIEEDIAFVASIVESKWRERIEQCHPKP